MKRILILLFTLSLFTNEANDKFSLQGTIVYEDARKIHLSNSTEAKFKGNDVGNYDKLVTNPTYVGLKG